MEAIMAILRMMIVDYLDAEMKCGWCVFFCGQAANEMGAYNICVHVQDRIF